MSEGRRKAWETRRANYGTAGHAGPYRVFSAATGGFHAAPDKDLGKRALVFVLRLYAQGDLSEGQCCKALQLDRVSFRELVDVWEPTV